MNPKPLVASDHFTVPVFTKIPLIKNNKSGCDRIGKRVMLPTGDQYATPTSPRVERVLPSAFVPPSRDENRELPVRLRVPPLMDPRRRNNTDSCFRYLSGVCSCGWVLSFAVFCRVSCVFSPPAWRC